MMRSTITLCGVLLLLGGFSSCNRCCRHCPDGEVQRISRVPKSEFYKGHYAPSAKRRCS